MEPGPGHGEGLEKGQEEGLQSSGSEDRTQGETSRGGERGCAPASGEQPRFPRQRVRSPRQAPARRPSGGRPRSLARWGWRERVLARLTRVPPRPGSQKGDHEGPVGHIPGTGRGGPLESRPRGDAVAQTKLGRRDARSVGPRARAPPPAARHYLHEDPEEQGSDPDLDGQLPHGAAGAAPGAAAAVVLSAALAAPPARAR